MRDVIQICNLKDGEYYVGLLPLNCHARWSARLSAFVIWSKYEFDGSFLRFVCHEESRYPGKEFRPFRHLPVEAVDEPIEDALFRDFVQDNMLRRFGY